MFTRISTDVFAAALVAGLTLPPKTWSALSRCLAPDGTIKDEASPELYSVRQEIRRVQQMCTRKVQDFPVSLLQKVPDTQISAQMVIYHH